jgi:hypothetical protein
MISAVCAAETSVSSLTEYSKSAREGKEYFASGSFGGNFLPVGYALTFGKYIKQDQIAAISVIGASRESRNFGDIDTDRDNVFVFQAEYRYFTNNTFYIKPSVYYRRVDEYLGENFLTGDEIRDDYRDIGVGFTIGNQWQLNNWLSVGVDWLGFHYNVLTVKSPKSGEGELALLERTATFFNLTVGASF